MKSVMSGDTPGRLTKMRRLLTRPDVVRDLHVYLGLAGCGIGLGGWVAPWAGIVSVSVGLLGLGLFVPVRNRKERGE